MQTPLFIILTLLAPVLIISIVNVIRKSDTGLREDVKRLRAENEALRKELLKRGIIEYV